MSESRPSESGTPALAGFTAHDVELLRKAADHWRTQTLMRDGEVIGYAGVELDHLASRIAALLPPHP